MGKKNKSSNLGRSLIKDRFTNNKGRKMVANNSMLHTTEIQDGYDWGRLNLQSVTEESSFQEFLSTAELAGTDFHAEKLNIKFVNSLVDVGLLNKKQIKEAKEAHDKHKTELKIPRRPPWSTETTPDELDKNEKDSFLEWRRSLAKLQEKEEILLTPYEKNLEFWRQLWRVVERSDVVVQIVDARNPLLFRCEDLEKYVKEVSSEKTNLILVNKADFLTEEQRQQWCDYFDTIGVKAVFYSAYLSSLDTIDENVTDKDNTQEESDLLEEEVSSDEEEIDEDQKAVMKKLVNDINKLQNAVEKNAETLNQVISKIEEITDKTQLENKVDSNINDRQEDVEKDAQNLNQIITAVDKTEDVDGRNSSRLLTREELIDFFKTIHTGIKVTPDITTIGLVGYPNVGKSSTINSLLSSKKVSVSATPGKTKHFQTHYLDKDILLCDCPGLVMPSFVFSKAEMILNGILPIDQMRDHVPPTNLLAALIPRHVIEDKYGIMIPKPLEGEDPNRHPVAEELLNAYAYNRGFMTANGQPDNPRAARYILKDYMNGKLLYCYGPPNVNQKEYHTWPERQKVKLEHQILPPRTARAIKQIHVTTEDIDKVFFDTKSYGVHAKGIKGVPSGYTQSAESSQSDNLVAKPWKQHNKHKNKGKKEKLRKVYAHLDQH